MTGNNPKVATEVRRIKERRGNPVLQPPIHRDEAPEGTERDRNNFVGLPEPLLRWE